RAAIGSRYGVAVLEASVGSVFDGRAVAVAQLRIVRGRLPSNAWRLPPQAAEVRRLHADYAVVVGRGATAVHETPDGAAGVPFVHTTDLRHGVWRPSARRSTRPADLDDQPALLLPRVGRPDRRKLVRIAGGPVVLSDCLFWLRTEPAGHEAELQRILLDDWAGVAVLYGGSCAPYATLAGLLDLLASRGLSARIHRRARPPAAAQRPATASVADVSPGRRRARS
ncbi:hypothetical protein, partial [uncultured Phenylobacterium sp.]|uniref:hypothetical protein n=1 Tax=uncultured Phenylobacterium sp. TaxID=349273 RepID=UPI0025D8B9BE